MIYVVSGFPRTGTSMMMQILQAGGLEVVRDDKWRAPDQYNPQGYFEALDLLTYDYFKETGLDFDTLEGKAIKSPIFRLWHLPLTRRYKVIFMQRNRANTFKSRKKIMNEKYGVEWPYTEEKFTNGSRFIEECMALYMHRTDNFSFKRVRYEECLDQSEATCRSIAYQFLPECKLKVENMISVIRR